MIQMVLKICKCCDNEIKDCPHQRSMRAFGFDELMDSTLTREEPPCETSNNGLNSSGSL